MSGRKALWEVAGFYGVIYLAIWGGQRLPWRPPLLLAGVLLIGLCLWSSRRRGDSREKIGLDRKWFKPAALETLKWAGPFIFGLLLWALTKPAPPAPKIIFGLLGYPLWAFAQEYAFLSFSANRLREALGERPWAVVLANGCLFALIHAPNPMLMTACLVCGLIFTRIFLKTPHLVPIALAHAAGGFLLSWIFLNQYNAMMVGPAYWKWAGVAGPHP